MTTKHNEEIVRNKQKDLIENIALLCREYGQQVDKKRDKIIEKEGEDVNTNELMDHLNNTFLILIMMKNKLQSQKDIKTNTELLNNPTIRHHLELFSTLEFSDHLAFLDTLSSRDNAELVDNLKETIEKMDQLVRDKYLPTRLEKIYEAIKTLLRDLIVFFAPFTGREVINAATHTLTSTRSTLFSEIKTLEKSLNPPEKTLNPPEETEQFHYYRSMIAPMFG